MATARFSLDDGRLGIDGTIYHVVIHTQKDEKSEDGKSVIMLCSEDYGLDFNLILSAEEVERLYNLVKDLRNSSIQAKLPEEN